MSPTRWTANTPDAGRYSIYLDGELLAPPFVPLKADAEADLVICALRLDSDLLVAPNGETVYVRLHGLVEIADETFDGGLAADQSPHRRARPVGFFQE